MRLLGILLAAWMLATPPDAGTPTPIPLTEVLTWPRMQADAFGCMLEKRAGLRDRKYNCALKRFKPSTNPCAKSYSAGPTIPDELAHLLNPQVKQVEADWEHGELQSLTLTVVGKPSVADVEKLLGVRPLKPTTHDDMVLAEASSPAGHENIASISIQNCSKADTCVVIQGFEHQGAGDVECP